MLDPNLFGVGSVHKLQLLGPDPSGHLLRFPIVAERATQERGRPNVEVENKMSFGVLLASSFDVALTSGKQVLTKVIKLVNDERLGSPIDCRDARQLRHIRVEVST